MTTTGSLDMTGLKEYIEKLDRMGQDMDKGIFAALKAGAKVLQRGMRARVPVDTGNLRDHILIKGPFRDGDLYWIQVGVIHDIAFTDKKTAIYANVIEYGSASVEAHPFVRPAIDEDGPAAWEKMRQVLAKRAGEEE